MSESSRVKSDGPTVAPNQYPTLSPSIAAAAMSGTRSQMSNTPFDASRPALNKTLSPGKKNPKKSPDSAKTSANKPT